MSRRLSMARSKGWRCKQMFSFRTIQHYLLKYQYRSEVDFCSTKPRRADNDWGNLSGDAAGQPGEPGGPGEGALALD